MPWRALSKLDVVLRGSHGASRPNARPGLRGRSGPCVESSREWGALSNRAIKPYVSDLLQPSPTLEDVARVAGLSRSTVSRVINGSRNFDPAVREAVRQAIAATGYVPSLAARSLVGRGSGTLALVVSGAGGGADGDEGAHRREVF